jgi:tetratricopeptide (TPR) repeat protein
MVVDAMAAVESMSKKSKVREAEDHEPAAPKPRRRGLALKVLVILLVAAAGAAGILWWQDRDLRKAREALAAKDPEQALRMAEQHLARHPDSDAAMALKARSLVALREEPAEAIRLFDQVGLANIDEMHAYAQAQLMLDQWSIALRYLVEVLENRPTDVQALHEITVCQIKLGMLLGALDSASRAAECEGHEAKGHVLLATIYRELEDHRAAAAAYEQALKYEPDAANLQLTPAEFMRDFGRALLDAGEPAKAAPQLSRSTMLEPSAAAYASLGEAYTLVGQPEQAVAAWKKTIELDPLNDTARQGLAAVALRDDDPKQALEWLRPLETQGRGISSTALLLASAYEKVKDEPAATRWRQMAAAMSARESRASQVKRMMVEDPGSPWAKALRAHSFALAGNWKQAQAMLDELPKTPRGELKGYVDFLAAGIEKKQQLPPLDQAPIPAPAPAPVRSASERAQAPP